MKKTILILSASLLLACNSEKLTPICDGTTPTYQTNVAAIIMQSCSSTSACHGYGANNQLISYNQIKATVDNGSFEKRVLVKQNMPKGSVLTQDEINTIQCWLNNGAKE